MSLVVPLTVAVPLGFAAFVAGLGSLIGRKASAAVALAAAAGTAGLQFAQLFGSWPHDIDVWFGNWRPQHHFAIGILFGIDPIDASMACTVGVLMVAALGYSWFALKDVSHVYYALMLAFLGGMSGFAVSGDLFNIFVFYELMSVTGYGLCSFRRTSSTVTQGALNFAIMNSIGAYFILMGIALVYGRTGALNLAQIAHNLTGHPPDGLIVISFVLILVGFLTKAGAVPFHFWLSDAYAVAAGPVGAIYAGIMSDLGYHAIARIYAGAFAGSLQAAMPSVRGMLIAVGVLTAVVGAVMCFGEADIKRQLAFLVISHGGIYLCGIGLLTPEGLAGSTMYVAADGMIKGALFLTVGYIVVSLGASDEMLLIGRGRQRRHALAGCAFGLGALGLAVLPGFGTWQSASLIVQSATASGFTWLPPVLAAATAVTAAAVLRAGGKVFLGWGPAQDPMLTSSQPDEPEEGEPEEEEQEPLKGRVFIPVAALLIAGYGMSFAPDLAGYAEQAGRNFLDLHGYMAEVLQNHPPSAPATLSRFAPSIGAWAYGAATSAAAVLLAAGALFWHRLPGLQRAVEGVITPPLRALKAVHTGRLGDMATWLTVGAVALLAAGAISFR